MRCARLTRGGSGGGNCVGGDCAAAGGTPTQRDRSQAATPPDRRRRTSRHRRRRCVGAAQSVPLGPRASALRREPQPSPPWACRGRRLRRLPPGAGRLCAASGLGSLPRAPRFTGSRRCACQSEARRRPGPQGGLVSLAACGQQPASARQWRYAAPARLWRKWKARPAAQGKHVPRSARRSDSRPRHAHRAGARRASCAGARAGQRELTRRRQQARVMYCKL